MIGAKAWLWSCWHCIVSLRQWSTVAFWSVLPMVLEERMGAAERAGSVINNLELIKMSDKSMESLLPFSSRSRLSFLIGATRYDMINNFEITLVVPLHRRPFRESEADSHLRSHKWLIIPTVLPPPPFSGHFLLLRGGATVETFAFHLHRFRFFESFELGALLAYSNKFWKQIFFGYSIRIHRKNDPNQKTSWKWRYNNY